MAENPYPPAPVSGVTDVPIGDYLINMRTSLGKGAFGEVYKGRHKTSRMLVAAKKIALHISYLAEGRAEAEAEAAAMRRVKYHPHLLKVIDTIYIEDTDSKIYEFWLVTEFCELGNLNDFCQSNELSLAEKLLIARQTAVGLAFLHNLSPKILHRDIKPGNILLHKVDGILNAKLGDFGFARNMEKSYISSFAGTVRFVAPELWPAEGGSYLAYGTPADVYSLGIVYGMLVVAKPNHPLHNQDRASQLIGRDMILAAARKDTVPEVVTVQATDPPMIRNWKVIIQRMTAVSPEDRPSIDEVEQTLVALQDDLSREERNLQQASDSELEKLRRQVAELQNRLGQPPATTDSQHGLTQVAGTRHKQPGAESQPVRPKSELSRTETGSSSRSVMRMVAQLQSQHSSPPPEAWKARLKGVQTSGVAQPVRSNIMTQASARRETRTPPKSMQNLDYKHMDKTYKHSGKCNQSREERILQQQAASELEPRRQLVAELQRRLSQPAAISRADPVDELPSTAWTRPKHLAAKSQSLRSKPEQSRTETESSSTNVKKMVAKLQSQHSSPPAEAWKAESARLKGVQAHGVSQHVMTTAAAREDTHAIAKCLWQDKATGVQVYAEGDYGDCQLHVHSINGRRLFSLIPQGGGRWVRPQVSVTSDGHFVVVDFWGNVQTEFSSTGELLHQYLGYIVN